MATKKNLVFAASLPNMPGYSPRLTERETLLFENIPWVQRARELNDKC